MRRHVIAARALLGLAILLFVAGYVLTALNGFRGDESWGDSTFGLFFPLVPLAFAVVGCLIASRQPRNPIGWIALSVGVGGLGPIFPSGYARYTTVTNPGALPFGAVSAWIEEWSWIAWVAPAGIFFILLFPDGKLLSRRWRAAAWLGMVSVFLAFAAIAFMPGPLSFNPAVRNPFGIESARPLLKAMMVGIVLIPISILIAASSLALRYRRSHGETRLQLKWFTASVAFVALMHFASTVATFIHDVVSRSESFGAGPEPLALRAFQGIAILTWIAIPVSAGIAILKYRLYSIDLVISKAVVFGSLAAFVTATYVAIVVGVGALLTSSSEPNLALSIAATAVVAVAFQPIKERVQHLANRLVYGKRSTPYEVLARLASETGMGYSADDIAVRVAAAMFDGTGAGRAELWLAMEGQLQLKAAWPPDPALSDDPSPSQSFGSISEADAFVAIEHEGEYLGALALFKKPGETVSEVDTELMRNLAAQVALVLRNARLTEQLKARLVEISEQAEELRASRQRIVTAQDAERRRIERDLHDGAQQRLLTLSLSLRMAEQKLGAEADPEIKQILKRSAEELKAALTELRELARGIHPAILREEGLSAAVHSLAERAPMPVTVTNGQVGRLPGTVEATAYFVASEALTNVARYSGASKADISLRVEDGWLVVKVSDDGAGGADPANGTGLRGLMDRVSALGGELEVQSRAGQGTVVGARIPCE
jgi:signal transduction histidine kinase